MGYCPIPQFHLISIKSKYIIKRPRGSFYFYILHQQLSSIVYQAYFLFLLRFKPSIPPKVNNIPITLDTIPESPVFGNSLAVFVGF